MYTIRPRIIGPIFEKSQENIGFIEKAALFIIGLTDSTNFIAINFRKQGGKAHSRFFGGHASPLFARF